jgi:hypothetical protein
VIDLKRWNQFILHGCLKPDYPRHDRKLQPASRPSAARFFSGQGTRLADVPAGSPVFERVLPLFLHRLYIPGPPSPTPVPFVPLTDRTEYTS